MTAYGSRAPRLLHVPSSCVSTTLGQEMVGLGADAGVILDPWQADAVCTMCGTKLSGEWAASEFCLICSRQNGKNEILLVRALGGLFLLAETKFVHTAHLAETAEVAFDRLVSTILAEGNEWLEARVDKISRGKGDLGVTLKPTASLITGSSGRNVSRGSTPEAIFRTRTENAGRGLSGSTVVFDEAMQVSLGMTAALLPTVSAIHNHQLIYTASAVRRSLHAHGRYLSKVRARALAAIEGVAADDDALAYMEWSVDAERYRLGAGEPARYDFERMDRDPAAIGESNPALGVRIALPTVMREQRSMPSVSYRTERLGFGDWYPPDDDDAETALDPDRWDELADAGSEITGDLVITVDIDPDRSTSCLAVAGWRADGKVHVELAAYGTGTGWVLPTILKVAERHDPSKLALHAAGPAGGLLELLKAGKLDVTPLTTADMGQASQAVYDRVIEGTIVHLGDPLLTDAVRNSTWRGSAHSTFDRKSATDIPLLAVAAAVHALIGTEPPAPPPAKPLPVPASAPEPDSGARVGASPFATMGF